MRDDHHEERQGQSAGSPRWLVPLSLAGFVAASLFVFGGGEPGPVSGAPSTGKLSDRLSFVEEEVPVRRTRSFDAVAMFALPVAPDVGGIARPADRSADAGLGAVTLPPPEAPPAAFRTLPRIVQAETAPPRRAPAVPPARPAELSRVAAAGIIRAAALAPAPAAMADKAGPARTLAVEARPETLAGGSGMLDRVAGVGSRIRDAGLGTAATVGDVLGSLADGVASTVGLR